MIWVLSIRHHLRFLGVTLLFAAIMPFLAFFGRSTDLFADIHQHDLEHRVTALERLLARQTELF
ncbi:MAG: hypothetical protein U0X92_09895 [Anaerolineales bacterium]